MVNTTEEPCVSHLLTFLGMRPLRRVWWRSSFSLSPAILSVPQAVGTLKGTAKGGRDREWDTFWEAFKKQNSFFLKKYVTEQYNTSAQSMDGSTITYPLNGSV